jgi:hypothetical protein
MSGKEQNDSAKGVDLKGHFEKRLVHLAHREAELGRREAARRKQKNSYYYYNCYYYYNYGHGP